MRVFVRVVEHGAFIRAADDLGFSAASVTGAVARLEAELGTRLLNRTTRRLSLTREGETYYQNCVRILDEIAEAEDNLGSAHLTVRGRLRVSIAQSFEALGFFPLLNEFMRRFPEVSVDVIVTDRAVSLVEEGIDIALRAVEIPPDAMLVARKVLTSRWITCASPAYLAEHGTPRALDELAGHNCIRFVSPSTGRAREWQFDEDGVATPFMPTGNLSVTSLDGAVASAKTGAGIVQVPDVLAYGAIMNGELQPVLTEKIVLCPAVMVVYPANRYLPARVRAFADYFASAYPEQGVWPDIAAKLARERACPA